VNISDTIDEKKALRLDINVKKVISVVAFLHNIEMINFALESNHVWDVTPVT